MEKSPIRALLQKGGQKAKDVMANGLRVKVANFDDAKLWIVQHDANQDAKDKHQQEWNTDTGAAMERVKHRLSSVEKKIIWFSGMASALGAIGGSGLFKFFGG